MNLIEFIANDNFDTFYDMFFFEKLSTSHDLKSFNCTIEEYNDYLKTDALFQQNKDVSFIYVLGEKKTNSIMAYMSLIADSVTITDSEKELSLLKNLPYRIFPAMKIAKLAVCKSAKEKYKNIGSFMLDYAKYIALECNETLFSCRFVTVDADILNNPSVDQFYIKNGFSPLEERGYTKKTRVMPMYADPL